MSLLHSLGARGPCHLSTLNEVSYIFLFSPLLAACSNRTIGWCWVLSPHWPASPGGPGCGLCHRTPNQAVTECLLNECVDLSEVAKPLTGVCIWTQDPPFSGFNVITLSTGTGMSILGHRVASYFLSFLSPSPHQGAWPLCRLEGPGLKSAGGTGPSMVCVC